MNISFKIIRLINPVTKNEYYEKNYGRFQVEILDGYANKFKKPAEFSGFLLVCSSYFEIQGKCKVTEMKNLIKIKPVTKDTEFNYTKKHVIYITKSLLSEFIVELCINLQNPEEKKCRDELYALFNPTVEQFKATDAFRELKMNYHCEFFRVEFEIPLMILFNKQIQIRRMSSELLMELYTICKKTPWLLCFSQHVKKYNLKEAKLAHFDHYRLKHLKNLNVPPLFMNAIRLYAFIKISKKEGHEIFKKETLVRDYHMYKNWNGNDLGYLEEKYIQAAIDYLSYHVLSYIDEEKNLLAFPDYIGYNLHLIRSFKRIKNNQPSLRVGNLVPCFPSAYLTEEQTRTIKHVHTNEITLLEGAPGTGKTEVLVALMAYFSTPLVVTYVGMMVDALQKRFGNRIETAHTIHHIIAKNFYNKDAYDTWLCHYHLLVIDEGSNVDIKLISELMQCLPHISRLVIVGDLGQIYPISPGSPFEDLVKTYPQHSFKLTENKRVDPDSRHLADIAYYITSNQLEKIVFNEHSCLRMLHRPKEDQDIYELLKNVIVNEFNVRVMDDAMHFQIVILRNAEREKLNNFVEQILFELKILHSSVKKVFVGPICLFAGKKIVFTKNVGFVKNGELGQVKSIKHMNSYHLLTLRNGKEIKLGYDESENMVNPHYIQPGYVTTCNKAQGSEWNNILFWVYENVSKNFTKEFPYVAISRAKKKCIVVASGKEEFDNICRYKAKERNTLLKYYLKREPTLLHTLREYDHIVLKSPVTLGLLPLEEPAVPVYVYKKTTTKKENN
jgi:hypothetical protein